MFNKNCWRSSGFIINFYIELKNIIGTKKDSEHGNDQKLYGKKTFFWMKI